MYVPAELISTYLQMKTFILHLQICKIDGACIYNALFTSLVLLKYVIRHAAP
jgi:hypothetical protein